MEFSRQEYWTALPCPSPGDLPDSGIEPKSPSLQADSLLFKLPRKPALVGASLLFVGFPGGLSGKEFICQTTDVGSIPGSERSPQRRTWEPTSVFLPGKSHAQRNLGNYSPWECKESDMT